MNQKLADFRAKKHKASDPIDWDERRNVYLAAVNDLYKKIELVMRD